MTISDTIVVHFAPVLVLGAPRRTGDGGMRQTGTVKFFNQSKGFGFIKPDEGDKDVFVHITAVERSGIGTLDEGMRVSFDTEPDKRGKGPKAVDLQLEA
jgi:CspA family cold shock protein